MHRISEKGSESSREQAATYVAGLASELALLARRNGLDTLGYLLDLVRMEAEIASRADGGH